MPNHCSNDLRISGDPKLIEAFFKAVKGDTDDDLIEVNKIIPYPEHFAKADANAEKLRKKPGANWADIKDGYNHGGYEWCVANWGTKWGLYSFRNLRHYQRSALVTFDTAWSPPCPVILKMSEMFPLLTFNLKFYEQGCAFKGVYECKAGEELIDVTMDYQGDRGG